MDKSLFEQSPEEPKKEIKMEEPVLDEDTAKTAVKSRFAYETLDEEEKELAASSPVVIGRGNDGHLALGSELNSDDFFKDPFGDLNLNVKSKSTTNNNHINIKKQTEYKKTPEQIRNEQRFKNSKAISSQQFFEVFIKY